VNAAPELPHDLLEIAGPGALAFDGPAPGWVAVSLERAPFVVVRRAEQRGGTVPVGVRGARRNERCPAWLERRDAVRRIRPEDLAAAGAWRGQPRIAQLAALDAVAEAMRAHGLAWGPTGSTGFQLATGARCVDAASDLDLLVRAPGGLSPAAAGRLLAALAPLPVAVDVQVETTGGAVALAELASGARRVVLRTTRGPILVPAPWAARPRTAPA
jgi:phosphoribosyl-dephospho-CoA transferase